MASVRSVAVLCDIHGNLPALDAVLAELAADPPDAVVIGGDVVAGPFPAEVLERLDGLPWQNSTGPRPSTSSRASGGSTASRSRCARDSRSAVHASATHIGSSRSAPAAAPTTSQRSACRRP